MRATRRRFVQGATLYATLYATGGIATACVLSVGMVGGCRSNGLKHVRAPRSGVVLQYNLEPGTTQKGHVKIGSTRAVEGLTDNLSQNVECDVALLVTRRDAALDARIIQASFSNIELDWTVAPSAGLSREDFQRLAAAQLKGWKPEFTISTRGKLVQRPQLPAGEAAAFEPLFEGLAQAILGGFVELPTQGIAVGTSWADAPGPGTSKRTVRATLKHLLTPEQGEGQLAELLLGFEAQRPVETETGPRTTQLAGSATVLLSSMGYVAALDGEAHEFDPRQGTVIRQIHARWEPLVLGDPNTTHVQTISDPCDADYVGSERCVRIKQAKPTGGAPAHKGAKLGLETPGTPVAKPDTVRVPKPAPSSPDAADTTASDAGSADPEHKPAATPDPL